MTHFESEMEANVCEKECVCERVYRGITMSARNERK